MPPVAKRDDKRRNKVTRPADKIYTSDGDLPTKQPPAPSNWDPRVKKWYRSLKTSAQSVFYEDSDWQIAIMGGHLYNDWFDRNTAASIREFRAVTGSLLMTEGDRRRSRIEVHRQKKTDKIPEGAKTVQEYRARLKVVG